MLEVCLSSACYLALLSVATPLPLPEDISAASYIDGIDRLNGVEVLGNQRVPGAVLEPRARLRLVPSWEPPYAPGTVIDVDVWIQSLDDTPRELRLVTFDTTDTDSAISLPGEFSFDFTGLSDQGNMYLQDNRLSDLALAYTGLGRLEGTMLTLPAFDMLYVGTFRGVTLPDAPGTYVFDVLNADDPDHGAALRSGFGVAAGDPLVRWQASAGEIIGEPLELTVGGGACATHAECDDGLFCNGRERCVGNVCRPARRLPCPPEACVESQDRCRWLGNDPASFNRSPGGGPRENSR